MAASLDALVAELREYARALVDAAGAAGLQPRITSTVRGHSEQRRLYNRFLAGTSGYPVAPPGSSAHEYGEAFDLVVSPMEALADVGYTWQTWGGGWNPADAIHFELPGASDRAREAGKYFLATTVGTAMGEAAKDVFAPITSYIPGIERVLKVSAEHEPGATASLAAELSLTYCRIFGC